MKVKPETITSFKAMWNLHPGIVLLLNKDRNILATNKAGEKMGISPEMKCYSLGGGSNICAGCKGNASLHKGVGMNKVAYSEVMKQCIDSYWIPVEGEEGVFVHFGNDISEYVRPEFMES